MTQPKTIVAPLDIDRHDDVVDVGDPCQCCCWSVRSKVQTGDVDFAHSMDTAE